MNSVRACESETGVVLGCDVCEQTCLMTEPIKP